jgi:Mg2+/Co2+ transporter CorB
MVLVGLILYSAQLLPLEAAGLVRIIVLGLLVARGVAGVEERAALLILAVLEIVQQPRQVKVMPEETGKILTATLTILEVVAAPLK